MLETCRDRKTERFFKSMVMYLCLCLCLCARMFACARSSYVRQRCLPFPADQSKDANHRGDQERCCFSRRQASYGGVRFARFVTGGIVRPSCDR